MNARWARADRLWMARAINSFPVPVSPKIKTVESEGATLVTCRNTLRNDSEEPTMSSNIDSRSICSRNARFSFRVVLGFDPVIDIGSRRIPASKLPLAHFEKGCSGLETSGTRRRSVRIAFPPRMGGRVQGRCFGFHATYRGPPGGIFVHENPG